MILLVDSLSRLAEAFGDADAAKEIFDGGLRPRQAAARYRRRRAERQRA